MQEVFRSTNLGIIAFLKPSNELPRASQDSVDSFDRAVAAETTNDSESFDFTRVGAVSLFSIEECTCGTPPASHEVQGLA